MKIKRYVDNKSKWYGEQVKNIIRVNFKKSRNVPFTKESPTGVRGIADSIVHEEMHARHPNMHERTVRRDTKKKMKNVSIATAKKIVSDFKKKAKPISEKVRRKFYSENSSA